MGMFTAMRDASGLSKLIAAQSIDIIHAHRAAEHWLALLIPGRSRRAALVRTWHRNPSGEHRPILNTLASHTAGCVCVSRDDESVLIRAGTPRARFIHGAVDTAFFVPRSSEHKNEAPVVGQAARWKRENGRDRGQRFTLDIFSQLSHSQVWSGQVIGRGELARELREHAFTTLKLSADRVTVVSTQGKSASEFTALLSGLDVGLVFCVGSDGASRPALEMLSCGVPLIVANVPGLSELADRSDCVQLGPRNEASDWARMIEALLSQPEKLNAMRAAARKRAENVHSFRARGEALAAFFQECVVK